MYCSYCKLIHLVVCGSPYENVIPVRLLVFEFFVENLICCHIQYWPTVNTDHANNCWAVIIFEYKLLKVVLRRLSFILKIVSCLEEFGHVVRETYTCCFPLNSNSYCTVTYNYVLVKGYEITATVWFSKHVQVNLFPIN